jgi:flagellar basal body L-ring protein FlgH
MAKTKKKVAKKSEKSEAPAEQTEAIEFQLGVNAMCKKVGDILTITVDLSADFGYSNDTKRSTRVASSLGNKLIPAADPNIRLGLNCFRKIPKDQREG